MTPHLTDNVGDTVSTPNSLGADHQEGEEQVPDETLADDCVLISGAGPVGLLLATVLANYGIRSVLLERNLTTTRWPKMDLTNARSMEQLRKLGMAERLRIKGVPSYIPSTVLISTGLNAEKAITSWLHPSVDQQRKLIREKNDGTMPLEPYQRISQAIFEAWLKTECDSNPLIDARFGWKVEAVKEIKGGVRTVATQVQTGLSRVIKSKYLVGCDGASSKTRTQLKIPLDGGPTPSYVLLIHFKSKDLTRLQKQGQFWHIFFVSPQGGLSGAIIAQDEVDTWTTHLFLPLGVDSVDIDSHEAVYKVLGGMGKKYEIKIDEILVRSIYRPYIALAQKYRSSHGHVFLAGDSCHQNIPTGGYGMNMGLGDAFDLGWKLAATMNKQGGPILLESYEQERRPVAQMMAERSGIHMTTHLAVMELLSPNADVIDTDTDEGRAMRQRVHDYYQLHDGENKDLGVEMGYRYKSVAIIGDRDSSEPEWTPSRYTPTTWPGGRAPHVFLDDGSAIFDHFGKHYTLVEFVSGMDQGSRFVLDAATAIAIPVKHLKLTGEKNATLVWEKRLVLVRPDGHVGWRGDHVGSLDDAEYIVKVAGGFERSKQLNGVNGHDAGDQEAVHRKDFSGTMQNKAQEGSFEVDKMGEFQK